VLNLGGRCGRARAPTWSDATAELEPRSRTGEMELGGGRARQTEAARDHKLEHDGDHVGSLSVVGEGGSWWRDDTRWQVEGLAAAARGGG
jgi:hypothetical protein